MLELRRCAASAPDYRPCHTSLVLAYVETGQLDKAQAALRDVRRLWPQLTAENYETAFAFRRPGDSARFVAAFRAAGMG
jgi:hypothetical protein